MGFWKEVSKKMPTWRGIIYFFYVASHWGNFSAESAEYRKRLQDQKEWQEESERLLTKIHQRDMELVKGDLKREMDEKVAIEQKAKQYEILFDHSLDLYLKAVFHLARMAVLYPPEWLLAKFSLDPTVRGVSGKDCG